MHTVDGRGTITSLPSLIIRPPTSTTGKYIGQVNLTAPAALGSKADLGLALPPIYWSESRLKAFGKGLGLVGALGVDIARWAGRLPAAGLAETD